MHEIIDFLKNAVTRGPGAGITGCYVFRGGSVYARNMTMQAGIIMPSKVEFNVPAEALDAALKRMKEIQSLVVDEGTVTIRSGRLSSTIKLNSSEPPDLPPVPEEWTKSPAGLTAALKIASNFADDQEKWTRTIRIMDGRVTAMTNTHGVDISVPNLAVAPSLLTKDVATFLIDQGDPDELSGNADAITFRWNDGRWLRAQLYASAMPNLDPIFASAGNDASTKIDDEWKEAYQDVVALSDGKIMLTKDGLRGIKEEATINVDCAMELPDNHESFWSSKVLNAMITCAEVWNPLAWPKATLFTGPNLRGVVMGQERW